MRHLNGPRSRPGTLTSGALADINGQFKPSWRAAQDWAKFAMARLDRCEELEQVENVLDALAIDAGWLLAGGYHRSFKGNAELARTNLSELASRTLIRDDAIVHLDELVEVAQPTLSNA
jgi:hypothetical protein